MLDVVHIRVVQLGRREELEEELNLGDRVAYPRTL